MLEVSKSFAKGIRCRRATDSFILTGTQELALVELPSSCRDLDRFYISYDILPASFEPMQPKLLLVFDDIDATVYTCELENA